MTRKYYATGSIIHQIADDNGICYLYKMKNPNSITSEWAAWDFIKRYDNFDECFHDLMKRLSISNPDRLKSFEIEEDKVLSLVKNYKSYNS